MPLRNERQAYWDDIERNIADVAPMTGTAALSKLPCPTAAAARRALKSRLASVDHEIASADRQRQRALAEARVTRNEDDARECLADKAARHQHAERFVRGRMENDRPEVREPGTGGGEKSQGDREGKKKRGGV